MYKRILKNLDYTLLLSALAIIAFSLVVIGSATLEFKDASYTKLKDLNILVRLLYLNYYYVIRQLFSVLLGLAVLSLILYMDYEDFGKYWKHLYVLGLLLLVSVMFLGREALGAQRWIYIGSFSIQPSEFAKLILIITFARFLSFRAGRLNTLWQLMPCFIFVGVPMLLVLKQPDLGTSLVFFAIMFGMLFGAGARPALLAGIIIIGMSFGVSLYYVHSMVHKPDLEIGKAVTRVGEALNYKTWNLVNDKDTLDYLAREGYSLSVKDLENFRPLNDRDTTQIRISQEATRANLQSVYEDLKEKQPKAVSRHEKFHSITLKEYQVTRLTTFVNPESDILGAGYHVWQSRIAIGSGGLAGKGLLGGTQSHYTFLPIRHTDFIYSVIGEEFGFMGSVALLSVYFILLYRGIKIATVARDTYGMLLATGVVSMLAFHILVNIGMTAGVMPVTGIPLPLASYGGTNMLMNLAALGVLLNVHLRRQKLTF